MRFILFLFFLTLNAHAQKVVQQESFQINIRPILSGILNDFYQMITLFPEYPKEMASVVKSMDETSANHEALTAACPRVINKKCLSEITNLKNELIVVEEKLLQLYAGQRLSRSLYMDNLAGLRLLAEFQTKLAESKGQIENICFLLKANLATDTKTFALIKELDELNTLISLAVVEFIPYPYKEDFRHFFFNFVHPIELQISKNKNYEFLNRNVEALNFAINLLNMNLTKRNKKTPEGMAPYLSTIHNRWNSILRYYL